ncbi:MAG: hypothetical protein O2856_01005, partial [Planctomycetota bacterium]|nr:hypothetical protein [Planctomycetota bacterium]
IGLSYLVIYLTDFQASWRYDSNLTRVRPKLPDFPNNASKAPIMPAQMEVMLFAMDRDTHRNTGEIRSWIDQQQRGNARISS